MESTTLVQLMVELQAQVDALNNTLAVIRGSYGDEERRVADYLAKIALAKRKGR